MAQPSLVGQRILVVEDEPLILLDIVQTQEDAGATVVGKLSAETALHSVAHRLLDQLTHEFLATMLGVRRPGVTEAIHQLEGEHLIKARRGRITILDRKSLVERAGKSYGIPEAEYRRLIGRTEV